MVTLLQNGIRVPACVAAVALSIVAASGIAIANESPVGFVSSVRGQPTAQNSGGAAKPLRPLQPIVPGTTVTLSGADSLDFCHESAAIAFRIEGAGAFTIEATKITPLTATLKVTERGRCGRSVPPSVPGGVLLRSLNAPPQ